MSSRPTLRTALRRNLVPALVLWVGAGLLLVAYYMWPAERAALDRLAALKAAWGLWFVLPAQAVAAGLLPWVFQACRRDGAARFRVTHLPWIMSLWAVQGGLTDAFYAGQARLFGDSASPGIILLKTAVDMLLYTPLVCGPLIVLGYAFTDARFDPARLRRELEPGWFRARVLPVYRAALLIWTPAVAVLYALPLALQFPVQVVVQCFFALIVAVLTRPASEGPR